PFFSCFARSRHRKGVSMILQWLTRLTSIARPRPSSPRRFRPMLEGLEERWTPSGVYTWKGGAAGTPMARTDSNNWRMVGGNHAYPGANKSMDDQVVFDNNATTNAQLSQSICLDRLDLKVNFGQTLEVNSNSGLTFKDVSTTGGFFMQGGT